METRIPAPVALAAAFGLDLVAAAALRLWHPAPVAALVVLAVPLAVLSWCSTLPGAAGAAALGWLFYSGFADHTDGRLGGVGPWDGVVLAVLSGTALLAAGLRHGTRRRTVVVPAPRPPAGGQTLRPTAPNAGSFRASGRPPASGRQSAT